MLGPGPEPVALATAGLKDEARMGVVKSHFAPVLPNLVPCLRQATGRRVAPLQDDGWAAAFAELKCGALGDHGYYLGSGTGLAEAISQGGLLVRGLPQAYQVGLEAGLRAEAWRERSDDDVLAMLEELLDWRSRSYRIDQVVLAQRFRHRPELGPALARRSGLEVVISDFTASPAVGAVLMSMKGAQRPFQKPSW